MISGEAYIVAAAVFCGNSNLPVAQDHKESK